MSKNSKKQTIYDKRSVIRIFYFFKSVNFKIDFRNSGHLPKERKIQNFWSSTFTHVAERFLCSACSVGESWSCVLIWTTLSLSLYSQLQCNCLTPLCTSLRTLTLLNDLCVKHVHSSLSSKKDKFSFVDTFLWKVSTVRSITSPAKARVAANPGGYNKVLKNKHSYMFSSAPDKGWLSWCTL